MPRSVILFGVCTLILDILNGCQGAAASAGGGGGGAGVEPQVAVLCEAGSTYHPQFMAAGGRWQPDLTTKPQACIKDKMEILDYCKKMYPSHDITNIVEASHYVKVSSWCKVGSGNAAKCKVTRWVKPFRCLEGPFQSDALLVPESCLFDHIHNQSRCWQFGRWNATAGRACAQRGLRLRTFAMLLPCGISLFSGVEFVCCPKHFKENVKLHKPLETGAAAAAVGGAGDMLAASAAMDEREDALLDDADADADDDALGLDDDDDDDDAADDDADMDEDEDVDVSRDADADADADADDDYTDGDESEWPPRAPAASSAAASATSTAAAVTAPPSTTTTQASPATSDPYFSHFDPRTEHQSYKDAQQRLEETHRGKITKVMKDWSELEARYQEMVSTDPQGAQAFRQRMTAKFQASVQSLEEAGVSERRRLAALHQQRVLAHLAQRRRAALTCYTRSLQDQPPNSRRVQKCLQRLVRALGAERGGALAAWRRAAAAGQEAAAAERGRARDRLQDADRALQRALASLRRRPRLYEKIGSAIEDYVQSMQSKEDMAVSLMSMTPEDEELLLDRVASEVTRKQQAREQMLQQQRAKQERRVRQRTDMRQERLRVSAVLSAKESDERDDEASEQETTSARAPSSAAPPAAAASAASSADGESTSAATTGAPPAAASASSPRYTDVDTDTDAHTGGDTTTLKYSPETTEWSTAGARAAVTVDSGALQEALEQAEAERVPPPAHALRHDISHGLPGFSVRGSEHEADTGAIYPALCVGGAALAGAAAVALAVARRRRARTPVAQGFVQVEQTGGMPAPTPEERHVANMQINGYENPTYKYFEVKE